jgi:hypothetical protein
VSTRVQLLLLAALVILVVLAWLFPRPAGAEVPAGRSMLAPSEFVNVNAGAGVGDGDGVFVAPAEYNRPRTLGWDAHGPSSASTSPNPAASAPATVRPSVPRPVSVAPVRVPTASMTGTASWFASPIGVSAAGPALRAALGGSWRGTVVTVTANGFAVRTQLGDFCQCYGSRVIDLDRAIFAALAPLSQGLMEVTISW